MFLITPLKRLLQDLLVFTWDFGLTLVNVVSPSRKVGQVTPEGHPGAGGKWPEYIAPKDGDSRCSCPALNALANHGGYPPPFHRCCMPIGSYYQPGILPRDGKNIKFNEFGALIRTTYNFAPSFCFFVPNFAANMLKRDYKKGTFDLADLDLHNGIEHDWSLTRMTAPLECHSRY